MTKKREGSPARRRSAGLLMFRRMSRDPGLELYLVHPGGPYLAGKEDGTWSLPKGEIEQDDDTLATALREFEEEVGIPAEGPFLELGSVVQRGGKEVVAWAFETRREGPVTAHSNTFEMEWPPRSGQIAAFPEVDRGEFFSPDEARMRLNPAQSAFIDRLLSKIPSVVPDD